MQKFALPVIFITAVAGSLFYVSQEEHGTGTLLLLAAVLLVGQICVTLPYIFESRKPCTGAVSAKTDDGNANKIIGNQQVIHEDLRSLGDALIKRFNILSERQDAIEKTLLAAVSEKAPELADNLAEIFEKQERRFDERFDVLAESLGEKLTPAPHSDTSAAKLDAVNSKLEALNEKTEELVARLDEVFFTLNNLSCENNEDNNDSSIETLDSEEIGDGFPEEDEPDACEKDEDFEHTVPVIEQGEFQLDDLLPGKGATLILDAMLGIENKPYLRGNAPGLSLDEGTPMDFVEIGRWSYDFAPLTEEVSVKILCNDREDEPLGSAVTLAPGQTLELSYVPDHR